MADEGLGAVDLGGKGSGGGGVDFLSEHTEAAKLLVAHFQ
jgi:hypothetical protein